MVARLERLIEPDTVGSAGAFGFLRLMIGAGSPDAAVAEAVRYCSDLMGGPAAGWLADPDPNRLSLVAVEGATAESERKVRRTLQTLRRERHPGATWNEAGRAFAGIAGVKRWGVADGGEAAVIAAMPGPSRGAELEDVGPLLADVVSHLRETGRARKRNQELDLGIALTAHEIKGPALAASAAIGSALGSGVDEAGRALLARSKRELRSLVAIAESMLKWSAGGEPIRRRPTDLVAVVREAIESSRADDVPPPIRVSAPPRLTIRGDRAHLRTAVANVVRNAIAFSPPEREVLVSVARTNGLASVIVEDRGPGIPDDEREGIFDPFVRGRRAPRARNGNGLGLFIARQVVEAHRGSIWLEGGGTGARFHIELPVD